MPGHADAVDSGERRPARFEYEDFSLLQVGLILAGLAFCAGLIGVPWAGRLQMTVWVTVVLCPLVGFLAQGRVWIRLERQELRAGIGWLGLVTVSTSAGEIAGIELYHLKCLFNAPPIRRVRNPDRLRGGNWLGVLVALRDGRCFFLRSHDPQGLFDALAAATGLWDPASGLSRWDVRVGRRQPTDAADTFDMHTPVYAHRRVASMHAVGTVVSMVALALPWFGPLRQELWIAALVTVAMGLIVVGFLRRGRIWIRLTPRELHAGVGWLAGAVVDAPVGAVRGIELHYRGRSSDAPTVERVDLPTGRGDGKRLGVLVALPDAYCFLAPPDPERLFDALAQVTGLWDPASGTDRWDVRCEGESRCTSG